MGGEAVSKMSREVTACDKLQKSEENDLGKGARMQDRCGDIAIQARCHTGLSSVSRNGKGACY